MSFPTCWAKIIVIMKTNNSAIQFGLIKQRRSLHISEKRNNNVVTANINMLMKCVFQFSLQDYKQKSIDFLKFLLNEFPNFHLVCTFYISDLLISFGIDFECMFRLKVVLNEVFSVLYFIFCISVINCSFYGIYHNKE